jgi:hypothetical protein
VPYREEEIARRDATIAEHEETIARLNLDLAGKEARLKTLEGKMSEKKSGRRRLALAITIPILSVLMYFFIAGATWSWLVKNDRCGSKGGPGACSSTYVGSIVWPVAIPAALGYSFFSEEPAEAVAKK